MSRSNASSLWNYFTKIGGTKIALCELCGEKYSFATTTGNLKTHLRKRHHPAYVAVCNAQEQAKLSQNSENEGDGKVIYEYIIAESPKSSVSNEGTEENNAKISSARSARILSRNSRTSFSERRSLSQSHRTAGKAREKRLIEQLTEEKISIAGLQKELVEKELEEKNLRVQLLQDEMEHKKEMHIWEKREKEHNREMNELAKQEMLLKIELLKANLENIQNKSSESRSLGVIE